MYNKNLYIINNKHTIAQHLVLKYNIYKEKPAKTIYSLDVSTLHKRAPIQHA